MNNRAKLEREIIKNLNKNISLEEISLNLSAPRAETDMLLMKIINRQHHICSARKPTCCPIHRLMAA